MTYELKSIRPLSVILNAVRIFLIIGFIVALVTFFFPNNELHINSFAQRLLAVLMFTIVYAIVVSLVLGLVSLLYNFWAQNFRGIQITLEPTDDQAP